jgi:hypothetical protein
MCEKTLWYDCGVHCKNKRWAKEKNKYMYRYIIVREQYIGNTGWDIKMELVSKSLCMMEKV